MKLHSISKTSGGLIPRPAAASFYGDKEVKLCSKRDKLREDFELATMRYRAQIETTNVATLSVDPVEFKNAKQKHREIEQAYKQASSAFLQHREQHRC